MKQAKVLSAGVIVVRSTDQGQVYLLLRAYQHWDFPKGVVEEGEQPFEGALREVREETTIVDLEFPWGKDFIETGPYGRGKVARYYLGVTQTTDISLPINPEIGKAEHEEFRWVTFDQAKQLVTPRVRTVLEWCQKYLRYAD